MQAFAQNGIVMNCQIVVCPGLNDGEQLSRTMHDLAEMGVASCAIVPVGVTKYRKGLYKMPVVDERTANVCSRSVENALRASAPGCFSARMRFLSKQSARCRKKNIMKVMFNWKTASVCCAAWKWNL